VAASINAGLSASTRFQMVSTIDIGHFAALSFVEPERFKNRAISLAGDELTFPEVKKVYRESVGEDLPETFWILGWLLVNMIKELRLTFKWTADVGSSVNIQELRAVRPEILTFRAWLEKTGRSKKR
jgi:hypothetical protein